MIKFEKIKPGMTLYDVRKSGWRNKFFTGSKWSVWPVHVKEVDTVNRCVLASLNGNPPVWFSEKRITKFRASFPRNRD